MLCSWADFAATGDPGWPAVTATTTPVKSWTLPQDDLTDDDTSPFRAHWRNVRFDLLHPG